MRRFLKRLFILLSILVFIGFCGAGAALYWLVAVNPGPEMNPGYIEDILGRESPVFYRDGSEKIGVLFQDAHRQYLPYHRIPETFVKAIVAAEDDQFFEHFGIDFFGIARAMIANIKAGRIIQGGSTITQQTAKNLFKRESRTYQAKLKELLYALRLEYHYPKEKILEFYINQFFVSGNGHGLGVAARYYFDKQADELTLLENAFIAGSVKRPNYYNPFTKSTEEAAATARKRARERATYVLRNMKRLGFITEQEFSEAMAGEIKFQRGRMSFALNTIMDLVRDGLTTPEINSALEDHGISNVSTSGIRIFTTIDKELQEQVFHSLRSELSRLDIRLRGYDREEIQNEYREAEHAGDVVVEEGSFLLGRIRSIGNDEEGRPLIRVDLGRKKPEGVIDREGMEKTLTALVRFSRQRWSSAADSDLPLLLDQLKENDLIFVSVRSIPDDGTPRLVLERLPELQGAALVMQEGEIRAMAGGMENRYFNRAVSAKRLMGSTFKPFLFTAAIQLGWNPTDMLKNVRDVFVYQDIPYFPRPDHVSPHEEVSMSWAGVNSENLAAIWLLYHLTDQLGPPRLREVAAELGLAPDPSELSGRQEYFKQVIRDSHGIVVTRDVLLKAAYDRAVKNLEADFLFEGRGGEYSQLKELPYGLNFDRYLDEVLSQLEEEGAEHDEQELELRMAILNRSYLVLYPSLEALEQNMDYFSLESYPARNLDPLALLDRKSGNLKPVGLFWRDDTGRVVFSLGSPKEGWTLIPEKKLRSLLADAGEEGQQQFWGNIEVEGQVSMYALEQVAAQMDKEKEWLFSRDPYSMEVLSEVRDYRILVGLQYLVHLGKEMGISAELEPVLSFPLGANVVSLLDAVRMYESMVRGLRFSNLKGDKNETFLDESSLEGLSIIERIETINGREIYARQTAAERIIDPLTAASVADILKNTVRYGTGSYASSYVRLRSEDQNRQKLLDRLDLRIPLLGKTGTANEFRNAAFLGYVPVLAEEESVMQLPDGYTVGVYVGFDDNKPMTKGTTHITGASGALPAWSEIAMTLVNKNHPGDRADLADLSFNGLPLEYDEFGGVFVPVNPQEGGAVIPGRGALRSNLTPEIPAVLALGKTGSGSDFILERLFKPYWKNK